MNRQEPYVGMPIRFDDVDDMPLTCCGQKGDEMAEARRRVEADFMPEARATHSAQNHSQNMQPMALAMAYVPWQRWTETYPLDEGLKKGTIFPDLYLPFEGRRKGGKRG